MRVMKAGMASPGYFQLMATTPRIIILPTKMSAPPVAQGGIDAKIGAKNKEMKKQIPVTMAVSPVRVVKVRSSPRSMKYLPVFPPS